MNEKYSYLEWVEPRYMWESIAEFESRRELCVQFEAVNWLDWKVERQAKKPLGAQLIYHKLM